MRLVDRGGDFFLRIFARELDQVRSLGELDPHRLAPLLGTGGNADHGIGIAVGNFGIVRGDRMQGAVPAGAGDQLPGREDARPLDFTRGLQSLEHERRIAVRRHVAHAGDTRLQMDGHATQSAHHGFSATRVASRIDTHVVDIEECQVRVQVDQAGHDRLAADVVDDRIRGPVAFTGIQHRSDRLALYHDRRRPRRRSSPVEQPATDQHERPFGRVEVCRHRNAQSVVRGRHRARQPLVTVVDGPCLRSTVLRNDSRRNQQNDQHQPKNAGFHSKGSI